MSLYITDNNKTNVLGNEAVNIKNKLQAATYIVREHKKAFYLERIPNIEIKETIYGEMPEMANKIMFTFWNREQNTGVLLTGVKGAGKTLLNRLIASKAIEQGIPVLLVTEAFDTQSLTAFIQSIDDVCCVLFDEFDKYYIKEYSANIGSDITNYQIGLLNLFDGTIQQKKLFVVTANEKNKINKFFLGRPGRLYYSFEFNQISQRTYTEFLDAVTVPGTLRDELIGIINYCPSISFDSIKAIIEECNRFNKTPNEVISCMNIEQHLDSRDLTWSCEIISPELKRIMHPVMSISVRADGVSLLPFNIAQLQVNAFCNTDSKNLDEVIEAYKALQDYFNEHSIIIKEKGQTYCEGIADLTDISDLVMTKDYLSFVLKDSGLKIAAKKINGYKGPNVEISNRY